MVGLSHRWYRLLQVCPSARVSSGIAQRFDGFVPRCTSPQGGVGVSGNGLLLFRVARNYGKNEGLPVLFKNRLFKVRSYLYHLYLLLMRRIFISCVH